MKTITLTERQIWFIKCAIEAKTAVIQLEGLDDNIFEDDYGITKKEIKDEIADLKSKLK
jgi:hypothetical protein